MNVNSTNHFFVSGTIVNGVGRGSKELGCPTANLSENAIKSLPEATFSGESVFYGWAQVNRGPVYKMVMSIGTNPHFKNKERTMVNNRNYS